MFFKSQLVFTSFCEGEVFCRWAGFHLRSNLCVLGHVCSWLLNSFVHPHQSIQSILFLFLFSSVLPFLPGSLPLFYKFACLHTNILAPVFSSTSSFLCSFHNNELISFQIPGQFYVLGYSHLHNHWAAFTLLTVPSFWKLLSQQHQQTKMLGVHPRFFSLCIVYPIYWEVWSAPKICISSCPLLSYLC